MNLIEKYIGEAKGLTKAQIFKSVLNVCNNWMDIDQIDKAVKSPISKQGLQSHIEELVKKGKLKEKMKKGKYIWKIEENNMNLTDKYLTEANVDDIIKKDMKKWLTKTFDMYNDLLDHMVKINMRDSDIKKEWNKVDKAIDNIVKIANKKGYFK